MNKVSVKTEIEFQKVKDNYIKEPFKHCIYILAGKERLFKKAFIAAMHSSMFPDEGDSEMNYSVFYDKNDAVGFTPLEVADTPPFGSKLRLIVIYKYNNFQEDFLDYCSNPSKTSIVILETENSLEEDPIYKYFSKKKDINNIYFIDFPLPDEKDFRGLINAYIIKQGKKISSEAIEYLINNINLDYDSLYSELGKICSYNDKEYLNVEDIADFTYVSKNRNIFDFLDAVFERDRRKSFSIMHRLDQDASSSLTLMMNNFMAIYYMKIFPPQTTLSEISKLTKIPEFILKKKKTSLKLFSLEEVVNILSKISYLNTLSVTTPANIFKAHFELFLFTITR
ncbi:DNA polymerase III subunit delta [Brachyspira hyodysenteriae]|uniref:DNA polymerase III subunit delta n=2 Tax=Brachyspira hyodysenteriae TaxID=159 RepID=UPI0022CD43F6|nr:DNA polymerase III subunit delta [Brachyspira hyodysenteriae]MCZ9839537.1 DNA polymerase III subunit delta [Brachyspira hyodysenteriae]MCZ9847179.1 DNA polymerase III subunit delta [Brachyspira hyodysenteriae]MCZ9849730.1 DNA polymerase III subunit delta [Brachyspira hyodysenteriae]MCZ9861447.1 DNA polymerase III subunit delta [Brachyspira hyodysenteriae]MCZ9872883.1 DNA polymerase III subunit delta [Brachyspira hyodysenteriae]